MPTAGSRLSGAKRRASHVGTTAPGQLKLTRLFGKSTGPTLADSAVAAEGDVTRLASANSAVVADRDAVEPSSESLTSTTEDREDNAECLSKLSRRGHGTEQSSVRGRESSDARCGESPLRGRSFQHTLAVKQDSPPHSSREEPPRLVWPKSGPEELRGEVTPKSSMKSLPLRERLLLRRSLTPPPVDVATSTEASALFLIHCLGRTKLLVIMLLCRPVPLLSVSFIPHPIMTIHRNAL